MLIFFHHVLIIKLIIYHKYINYINYDENCTNTYEFIRSDYTYSNHGGDSKIGQQDSQQSGGQRQGGWKWDAKPLVMYNLQDLNPD